MNFAINSTKNFILFNYYIIFIIYYEKQINLNFKFILLWKYSFKNKIADCLLTYFFYVKLLGYKIFNVIIVFGLINSKIFKILSNNSFLLFW